MPAESFSESSAVKVYLRLMHELVTRIDLVAAACEGRLNLSPPYAREYCYLQFRRMCELIALGCLQLHGDLPSARTSAVKKEWNAEKIMRRLHKDHPHSFPQCATNTKKDGIWHLEANSKPEALTLKEFKKLYNKCGEILHRGTIKTIESEDQILRKDYDEVLQWQRSIVDLVNQHIITRPNGKGLFFVILKSENGLPACSIFSNFAEGSVEVANYNLNLTSEGKLEDNETKKEHST